MSKIIGRPSKKVGHVSNLFRQEAALLEFFYENPASKLTVRKLAAETKINRSTIQYQLKQLKEEGLVSKDNKWIDSWQNRLQKINYYIEKFARSGLIDYLEEKLAASTIILFGSFRKGEAVKDSDIDIFVECAREKEVNLGEFEKKLGHKIQVFTKPKITLLPAHLLNNVVNGIKLKGYFTIK